MLELPLHKSDSLYTGSFSNERPVDLVSADVITTIDRLGFSTALGVRDDFNQSTGRIAEFSIYCHIQPLIHRHNPECPTIANCRTNEQSFKTRRPPIRESAGCPAHPSALVANPALGHRRSV